MVIYLFTYILLALPDPESILLTTMTTFPPGVPLGEAKHQQWQGLQR